MPDLEIENSLGRTGGLIICGVDEAGRGPLAGPVVAAAAIIPAGGLPAEIAPFVRDSKKLTEKKREMLFPYLVKACPHAIAEASVEEIDRLNILHASLLAMKRAIEALPETPVHALIDGNKTPPSLPCASTTVIKGDDISLSISVASILAKVTRDRFMKKLAEEFPAYGWEKNAGYGTKIHMEALKTHGATIWHRRSFAPVRNALSLTG